MNVTESISRDWRESMIGLKGDQLAPSDLQALAARWIDEHTAKQRLFGHVRKARKGLSWSGGVAPGTTKVL